ncbi:MAG: hypothetical protein AB2826_27310 [Candidatus Thiodiazotropha sp.]
MSNVVKSVIYGSLLAIGLGVIGYFAVVFYHVSALGIEDSKVLVEIIRSKKMMYFSMPYTLIALAIATFLVVKKLHSNHLIASTVIILLTAASITVGPLKIISIHMNYLPILLGGLLGVVVGKKLNKSSQQDASKAGASA